MGELFKRFLDFLPLPLLLAVAAVAALACATVSPDGTT